MHILDGFHILRRGHPHHEHRLDGRGQVCNPRARVEDHLVVAATSPDLDLLLLHQRELRVAIPRAAPIAGASRRITRMHATGTAGLVAVARGTGLALRAAVAIARTEDRNGARVDDEAARAAGIDVGV